MKKLDFKKEILKCINKMSGKRSPYQVFSDWIEMMAIAIQNACAMHGRVWQAREERYKQVAGMYAVEEQAGFSYMLTMLALALEDHLDDALGDIYMRGGIGNKGTGQFFTPYHLSKLTAELAIKDQDLSRETISLSEPSCGAGGMIIAAADVLRSRGIDYQKRMRVVAQDLDLKAVYACYVQLSLLGIDAIVAQGDTLAEPYTGDDYPRDRVFLTPKHMGVLI